MAFSIAFFLSALNLSPSDIYFVSPSPERFFGESNLISPCLSNKLLVIFVTSSLSSKYLSAYIFIPALSNIFWLNIMGFPSLSSKGLPF
jgi:hypothetical protein